MHTPLRRPQSLLPILCLALLIATSAHAATETVLYTFTNGADGAVPFAGVIQDANGNLYGTAPYGSNGGVVFELMPNGGGTWTQKILHTFDNPLDGDLPMSSLVFDAAGNLYGSASRGGKNLGYGVIFELSPDGSGNWNYKVLYRFTGGGDGGQPNGMILDSKGNLWGTTSGGTVFGSIFEMVPGPGGAWSFHLRWIFEGNNEGNYPLGNLVVDGAGNFYGTTSSGGAFGFGTVYRFSFVRGGAFVHPVPLHAFTGGTDGKNPLAGLIRDSGGNLYGTTMMGGTHNAGTIFRLSPSSTSGWVPHTLHAFTGFNDGAYPQGSLVFDSAGNLYGTTTNGGKDYFGTVFALTRSSSGWSMTTLHTFTGNADGAVPSSNLIFDSAGNLYGTASGGGAVFGFSGYGVVFQITP